jgi:WD40 repeat protein
MWFALDRQVREEKQGLPFPVIPVLLPAAGLAPGFLFVNTWIDLRRGLETVDAGQALDAFERAMMNTPAPLREDSIAERATAICPYRGLQVFREEDAAFFFGRATCAKQLLDFSLGKDLVAVVGPSGCGKSSVVQAGLLPLLRRERPPAETWDVASFTPGNDPFHRLASALIQLLEPDLSETERLAEAEELGRNLAAGKTRMEAVLDRLIEKSNGTGRLLLVADQFEELFTITPDAGRRLFAQALLRALGSTPFTLLVTLRADFYGQIITLDRELSDRLARAQVNVGALTVDELRESITAPAKLVGLEFEPGLAERILADVGSEPGRLPLVEFALTELWQRRDGKLLANQVYDEIEGVTGALARRAEAEFGRLKPEQQTAARRLFTRLVRVARPDEAGEDTRQRADLGITDTAANDVANGFADARLLVTGRDASPGTLSVEVAHEALIRNWGRLRGWLNEDREFLLWRQRLQAQVEDWQGHGREVGYLLRGAPLSEAERWFLGRPQDLAEAEQRLINESIALREREREEEEQRRRADIENAKRLQEAAEARAEAEKSRVKVLRRSALALGALLLLALSSTGFASWQRAVARARELVAASRANEGLDPELSMLIATHSVAATWPWVHRVLPEAEEQLHRAILASRVRLTLTGHRGSVESVTWSPNGKQLATASEDGTVKVWEAGGGKQVFTLTGHTNYVSSVAWSPDGNWLVTGSHDDTARVWDAHNGKELRSLNGHTARVLSVAWNPDGRRVATGSEDRSVKVWDALAGRELLTLLGHIDRVWGVTWCQDGKKLAAVASGRHEHTAVVWDVATGLRLLTLPLSSAFSVACSPDGQRLATGSGSQALVWDVRSGQKLNTFAGHGGSVSSIAWSQDGARLATGSEDRTAKVWDAATGQQLLTLSGHSGSVSSIAWSPDGTQLATASSDGTVRVWDVGGDKELMTLGGGANSSVLSLAWSPDAKRLAIGSNDNMARVWNAVTREHLLTLSGHRGSVQSVAWSPDGTQLATASSDGTVKVWDVATGKELHTLRGHNDEVFSVAWSPDGRRLATGSLDTTVRIWDAASGQELGAPDTHANSPVYSVAWSPDGEPCTPVSDVIGKNSDGRSQYNTTLWDIATGKPLLKLGRYASTIAWSPNGKKIATTGADQTVIVWGATGKELLTISTHADFDSPVVWSPNGERLATNGDGNSARVWDANSGQELVTLRGHSGAVLSVAWSPDGKWLATGGRDGTVQLYAMEIRDLMELARERLTPYPSEEGCRKFLRVDKCPPVPQLSFW